MLPSFASVARKIGGDYRLEKALKDLGASVVQPDIHNAGFVPRRADIRNDIKGLEAEAKRFETALNPVSKHILYMPVDADAKLLAARQAMRDITALCERTLSTISARGGAPERPGRVVCAIIVIEAWTFVRSRAPGANNKHVSGFKILRFLAFTVVHECIAR
jgi:hypothetical protein